MIHFSDFCRSINCKVQRFLDSEANEQEKTDRKKMCDDCDARKFHESNRYLKKKEDKIELPLLTSKNAMHVVNELDHIHYGWKLPNGQIIAFDSNTTDSPGVSLCIYDDIDEYESR